MIKIEYHHNEVKDSDTVVVDVAKLHELALYQPVTVKVKAVCVGDCVEVSGGKKKQDLVVADATGHCRVTIWEEEIGKVEEDVCYRMQGMMVREFCRKKFLSTLKEDCFIKKINDIGSVEMRMRMMVD